MEHGSTTGPAPNTQMEHDTSPTDETMRRGDETHGAIDRDANAGSDATRSELFDVLPEPVIVVDPAGTYVDVNRAALALLGYARGEILGMRVEELGAEGAEVSRRRLEQLLRGGFRRGSLQLRHADGSTVRVFLTASIAEMEDGPRYVAVLRRTEEVDVLEDLALAAETRLMSIVDSVVDAIITIDHEQRIQVFNAAAERLFRCPAADAIGRPIDRFIPDRFREAHHRDVARFAETGTTTRTMGQLGTVYGVRADGEEFPMEATISKVDVGGHPLLTVIARDVSDRVAIAIENARLYDRERHARREAELATGRLRLLADLDEALLAALNLEEAAAVLVRFLAGRIGDYAVAYLVGRDGQIGQMVAAHRDAEIDISLQALMGGDPPDLDGSGSLVTDTIVSGRGSLIVTMTDEHLARLATAAQLEGWRSIGCVSSILVPIPLRNRILGAISICRSPGSDELTDDDLKFLRDVAERAAQALDNARLYNEQTYIAETLQSSLLPPSLPEIPGLSIGVAYRPAGDGTQVGGDFYDVFETATDEWAISIGDVCGKGSGAAAIMALSRYTIRTAALHQSRPSEILATLNEALLRQTTDARFCTACQVRLRRTGDQTRLTLSCGGHPLPLILRADGSLETAGVPGSLLGFFPDPTLADAVVDLGPGDTVLLYTDGLTDERRDGEEFGEERLAELLRSCEGVSADEIVTRLMTGVLRFREEDPQDDIAVLALQVRGA